MDKEDLKKEILRVAGNLSPAFRLQALDFSLQWHDEAFLEICLKYVLVLNKSQEMAEEALKTARESSNK